MQHTISATVARFNIY